ncbi:rhodanese-like domain-containing protein [Rapidithrix thailandica]|uniref:Rhodanese-like domain-containing protein n=1 Tax=Rapidithrix thailandica TaxID=413964 RepID=A0AAW9S2C3_9BACT
MLVIQKRIFLLLLALGLVTLGYAQRVQRQAYAFMLDQLLEHRVPEISVREARALREVTFLDSRTRDEFEVSHLPGAKWVGYDAFTPQVIQDLPKEQAIIVYCSVGYRSEKIAQKLRQQGYQKVFNLYGGIFEWVNQHQPIEDKQGHPTRKVHAYDRLWGIWLTEGQKVYELQDP